MGIHLIYGLRVIHMTKTGTKAVKPIYLLKAIPPVLFIKLQWRVSLDPKELYKLGEFEGEKRKKSCFLMAKKDEFREKTNDFCSNNS